MEYLTTLHRGIAECAGFLATCNDPLARTVYEAMREEFADKLADVERQSPPARREPRIFRTHVSSSASLRSPSR